MANKLVRNEQRKLTATYINGVALALVAVGVFAQVVAFAQNLTLSLAAMSVMVCCGGVSVVLHWVARRVLGMTEFDLIMAMLMGTCAIAALGALWIARKDNTRTHPPAGE